MKKPENPEELWQLHQVLRREPYRFIDITDQWIADDPTDAKAYFSRHQGWLRLGRPCKALDDINEAIRLAPDAFSFWARAEVWRALRQYQRALADLDRAEALDPAEWQDWAYGLLDQADCHAHLGDEASALACCARLPDDFWAPCMNGAPGGRKDELPDKLRAIAAAARNAANNGG